MGLTGDVLRAGLPHARIAELYPAQGTRVTPWFGISLQRSGPAWDDPGMEATRNPRQYLAKRRPIVELDEGRILAAADDLEELRELGLDTVQAAMSYSGGELVREAGTRTTHRVIGPKSVFFLKRHRGLAITERYFPFRLSASSPARVEWDNHVIMRRSGFDVPDPVACGEISSHFSVPAESFLVTREVPGPNLHNLLRDRLPGEPGRREASLGHSIIRDLAGLVRRLHSSGFIHRDLYCAHLIVADDPRWGRPYIVDLQRVDQRFPPRHRWLIKDLAALLHSLPENVSKTDSMRFLLSYLGKTRLDPLVKRWAQEIAAKQLRMAQHTPKHP